MADNYLLKWDQLGEHFYETGVDHCVLYPFDKVNKNYPKGVAWNGIYRDWVCESFLVRKLENTIKNFTYLEALPVKVYLSP